MTRNEYIASIMLEAADILKNDKKYTFKGTDITINGDDINIENDLKILNSKFNYVMKKCLNQGMDKNEYKTILKAKPSKIKYFSSKNYRAFKLEYKIGQDVNSIEVNIYGDKKLYEKVNKNNK